MKRYLIRSGSFWAVKNSSKGSWIWKKLLKYRDIAKLYHKVEVKNGKPTSFWFDNWSPIGCISEKLGDIGCIDLGIPISATVGEVMNMNRRRKHRTDLLQLVEEEVRKVRLHRKENEDDIVLWKGKNDRFMKKFISKDTWSQLRLHKPLMEDYKGIWFPYSTPKYSFFTWLVMKNRIAT